jgi:hypothetical protein
MPGFSFSTIEPNQLGQVTKWDVPFNDWMGLKFGNGHEDTMGNAISQATEDFIWDDNNPVRPEVANRAYGIEGQLKFDKPISIQRARLMHERKRGELERLAYIESASHSWASAKAVAGFGASLVGGMSHPLDLGLAFLPFIGSEKEAASIAKLGGNSFRQMLARGVVTSEEALAASKVPYAKLTGAVVDGILNQSIAEIPVAIEKHRNQAAYGLEDSAFNILAGGAFSGAVKGLGLALEKAAKLWRELDPRMREAAIMDTAKTILTGDPPRAHWAFGMDEATIRDLVETKARMENPFEGLATTPFHEDVKAFSEATPEQAKTFKGTVGGYTGMAWELGSKARTPEDVALLRNLAEEGNAKVKALKDEGKLMEAMTEAGKQPSEAYEYATGVKLDGTPKWTTMEKLQPGYIPPVPDAKYLEAHPGVATPESSATDATREQAVNNFLAKAKADYESRIKGIVDDETRRVIDEVKRQTPPLPKEDVKKYSFKPVPDDANIKALEEDIAAISDQILNMATTPEERANLEAQIKVITKELDEHPASAEKAVDAMIPCVTSKAKV